MQYILNEFEYQEFFSPKKENIELSRELANEVREKNRELSHSRELLNKKLAEQAHELLVKEAELADLSSRVRTLAKENQTYCNIIAEMQRDCEGTSARLLETERLSAARLASMNNLVKEIRRLKNEHVCVAQNPKTGTVAVISAVKADTYRKFGWTVSEEYLVSRPA